MAIGNSKPYTTLGPLIVLKARCCKRVSSVTSVLPSAVQPDCCDASIVLAGVAAPLPTAVGLGSPKKRGEPGRATTVLLAQLRNDLLLSAPRHPSKRTNAHANQRR